MTPVGSQQWQQYLFYAATLFLLYEIWRGWQLGAVRGMLRLAALFCAWIGGSIAAGATGSFMAFFSKVPPLLAPGVAALTAGLTIYLGIAFLSGLLFKRTEDHEGVIRFGFGFFGAFFGAIYGALFLWGGITMIRGLGALGELRVVRAQIEGRPLATESTALFLMKLKQSLELGETGRTLKGFDPLPTAFYDNIVKFSMIAGNQKALERFIQYPAVLEVIRNPKVMAFLQDPALQKAADSRNIFLLVQNQNLVSIVRDPQILAQLQKINLTAALDFALNSPIPQIQMQPGKLRRRVSPISPPPPTSGKTAASPTPTP